MQPVSLILTLLSIFCCFSFVQGIPVTNVSVKDSWSYFYISTEGSIDGSGKRVSERVKEVSKPEVHQHSVQVYNEVLKQLE